MFVTRIIKSRVLNYYRRGTRRGGTPDNVYLVPPFKCCNVTRFEPQEMMMHERHIMQANRHDTEVYGHPEHAPRFYNLAIYALTPVQAVATPKVWSTQAPPLPSRMAPVWKPASRILNGQLFHLGVH